MIRWCVQFNMLAAPHELSKSFRPDTRVALLENSRIEVEVVAFVGEIGQRTRLTILVAVAAAG